MVEVAEPEEPGFFEHPCAGPRMIFPQLVWAQATEQVVAILALALEEFTIMATALAKVRAVAKVIELVELTLAITEVAIEGPAAVGQATMEPAKVGPDTLGPAVVGPATEELAAVEPDKLGPAALGPAAVVQAAVGQAKVWPDT